MSLDAWFVDSFAAPLLSGRKAHYARFVRFAQNQKPGVCARSMIKELRCFFQVRLEFMNDAVLWLIALHALKRLTVLKKY